MFLRTKSCNNGVDKVFHVFCFIWEMRKEKVAGLHVITHIFNKTWIELNESLHYFGYPYKVFLTLDKHWVLIFIFWDWKNDTQGISDVDLNTLSVTKTWCIYNFYLLLFVILVQKFEMKRINITGDWLHRRAWNKTLELFWHFTGLNMPFLLWFTHFYTIKILNSSRFSSSCCS